MNNQETKIFDQLTFILCKLLKVDRGKIKPDARLISDLGAESVDFFEIIVLINEAFNLKISEQELPKFEIVSDIVEFIYREISCGKGKMK